MIKLVLTCFFIIHVYGIASSIDEKMSKDQRDICYSFYLKDKSLTKKSLKTYNECLNYENNTQKILRFVIGKKYF